MKTIIAITILAALINACQAYFWIKGTKLMDSKGNEFLIRGINTANADNDYRNPPSTYYDGIYKTGANAVRIQWLIDDEMKGKALSDNNLKVAIQTAIDKQLIPILELWTYTGDQPQRDQKTHPENLKAAGDWWVRKIKSVLKPFEDKLLINIANEWVNLIFIYFKKIFY
jgi:mannan endo-1,4-beta-mannosidase